jgi:hypothetical protein
MRRGLLYVLSFSLFVVRPADIQRREAYEEVSHTHLLDVKMLMVDRSTYRPRESEEAM